MYFTSTEVDTHEYLYLNQTMFMPKEKTSGDLLARFRTEEAPEKPEEIPKAAPNSSAVTTGSEKLCEVIDILKSTKANLVPFRYNPLHDIESLWWLALFLLLAGTLVDAGSELPEILVSHRIAQQ